MPDQIDFDPEALQTFRNRVRRQLDLVDEMIPAMSDTDALAAEPAFGRFPEAQQARTQYQQHFTGVWNDIQHLKSALEAIDEACTTTLDNYGVTEDATAQGLDTMAELTDPNRSTPADGGPIAV